MLSGWNKKPNMKRRDDLERTYYKEAYLKSSRGNLDLKRETLGCTTAEKNLRSLPKLQGCPSRSSLKKTYLEENENALFFTTW